MKVQDVLFKQLAMCFSGNTLDSFLFISKNLSITHYILGTGSGADGGCMETVGH